MSKSEQFSVTQQDIFKALPDCKFSISPFDINTLTIEFTSTSDGLVVVSRVNYAHVTRMVNWRSSNE